MPLSDAVCRAAKSATKPYKISDGGGLHLLVEKNGSRLWRQAYRFDGKQKLIALGAYPAVGLADARAGRDANKALLAKGIDPSAQRKLDRSAARIARSNTFRIVADELITKFEAEGDDPKTIEKKKWLLGFINADLGDRPIAEIKASELLDVLRKIERRGRYDTARRARSISGRVFKYAISTNRAERDPSADLTGALIAPKVSHRAAITEPKAVGALLRAIDDMDGQITTRAALQLIALTFVRPGELRHAEWKEFDLRDAVWNIPKEKMKMPRPHKVPLSRQAITIINDLREVTGTSPYLFPQIRSWHRPISDGTLNAALRRLGYTKAQVTAHGFRSTASTLLNESRRSDGRRRWDSDAIERQLAHQEEDEVRGAYNGAEYWEERVPMMQWYADYLDDLRKPGTALSTAKAQRSRSSSAS
ncbi:Integrase [Tardiphaga sp. OK246]|jgi:integrase|uniref:tyrosine-type recombinase/integrase n=1 Tax=Tardiphaga sp. OK246 TaxID=1855307 RepID=UPI000B6EDA16|nr:integrase arm-type DNA-binding domain-containing protein [Tardiphaga sp. OK246]SNT53041.1 Integrase [Tardiphaga sp. OK246]